jgi:hypothetical protein
VWYRDNGVTREGIVHSREASSKETDMNLQIDAPVLALTAGQMVTLDDACGTRIAPRLGTVWITQEGKPEDNVVGPGEVFTVTRRGRTLLQAMNTAWVSLCGSKTRCTA